MGNVVALRVGIKYTMLFALVWLRGHKHTGRRMQQKQIVRIDYETTDSNTVFITRENTEHCTSRTDIPD